jgi:hypothetical protein
MSTEKELMLGFTKPLRDLVGSIVMYALVTSGKTITSTLQNQNSDFSFNIWLFLAVFIGISAFDDFMSSMFDSMNRGYSNPIDTSLRMIGLLLGTVVFSPILMLIYVQIGGSVDDAFLAVIVSAFGLIIGMSLRVWHYSR